LKTTVTKEGRKMKEGRKEGQTEDEVGKEG
jgi:hypothetical protein